MKNKYIYYYIYLFFFIKYFCYYENIYLLYII